MTLTKPELTMFAVAAVGVSALAGYGIYRIYQSRNERRKVKQAVDKMVSFVDQTWPARHETHVCFQSTFEFDFV